MLLWKPKKQLTVLWHAANMLLPAVRPDLPSRVSAGAWGDELLAATQAATREPSAPKPPLMSTCLGAPARWQQPL